MRWPCKWKRPISSLGRGTASAPCSSLASRDVQIARHVAAMVRQAVLSGCSSRQEISFANVLDQPAFNKNLLLLTAAGFVLSDLAVGVVAAAPAADLVSAAISC